MSEWKITTLGQEVNLLTGYPFKSAQYTDDEGDVILLRGDNIGQGFLRWENAKRWSTEKIEEIEDYFLQKDDVVLAMDRPWIEAGLKFAYLSQDDLPCLLVQRVSRLRAKEKLNQTFLRYVIQGYEFTQYIIKTQTGTAVPHISGTQIKDFEFLMPPLGEQEEIAKTLDILDRKIENLRRQNETLEAIAQTLFKHWFIDFEFPNEDGKPYKSSGGAMERSELGEIPAGWRVGKFRDITAVINGRAYKQTEFREQGTPIVRIQNLTGKGQTVYSDLVLDKDKYISKGDLIYAWSATFGPYIWRGVKSIYHYHIWKLNCFNPTFKYYLYIHLKKVSDRVQGQGTGSIFTHITKELMESQELSLADEKVMERWHSVATPIFDKIMMNYEQIKTLTQTRDVLLPKLMSGKLHITE